MRVGTDRDNVVLEVADTGPGMSEKDAARVFERFFRADSSRTRASGGAGLGLPIVDSLVKAHGGTVAIITGRAGLHVPGAAAAGHRVARRRVSPVRRVR